MEGNGTINEIIFKDDKYEMTARQQWQELPSSETEQNQDLVHT